MNHQKTQEKRSIVVIDPAVHIPEIDTFNTISRMADLPCRYHLPALGGTDSLDEDLDSKAIAGIIVLGSASSALDQSPWQIKLSQWLLGHIGHHVPTLGICFGHQLIAHLFGAEIGFLQKSMEKAQGQRMVKIHPDKKIFSEPKSGPLIISHREMVKTCPESFDIWLESPEVAIDGLYHKSLPIWTTQPHPEATKLLLKNLGIDLTPDSGTFTFGHSLIARFLEWVTQDRKEV
jgi:GMP synthase-like glutamine amidotransferase